MIFDTHAHYDSNAFQEDRDKLLASLPAAGIGAVLDPGCTIAQSQAAITLAERHAHVWAAVGIHPSDCAGVTDEDFETLRDLCRHEKVIAIGEIGLDYYWKDNPDRTWQHQVLRRQLELALELDLPVIIHDREAHGDCLAIVKEYPALRGVFHCFSGSPEMAEELLELGWYLGFDGPVTYKNAKRAPEVAAVTPLDRMLVETDAPYLTPVPFRGKRNDSTKLPYIIQQLAVWKKVDPETLTEQTWENGLRLFRLTDRV